MVTRSRINPAVIKRQERAAAQVPIPKGICPVCLQPLKGHPKCSGCGILIGPGHIEGCTTAFRGHELCGQCIRIWQVREKYRGPLTWEQFKSGRLKLSPAEAKYYGKGDDDIDGE